MEGTVQIAIAVCALLAGHGARAETPDAGTHAAPVAVAAPTTAPPPPAPTLRLRDVHTRIFRLASGAEARFAEEAHGPSLVNLWATWCEPCVKEMPKLVELHKRYGKHVRFIGIAHHLNTRQNQTDVRHAASAAHMDWPQYLESDGDAVEPRLFGKGTSAMPAFVLFDKAGAARLMLIGSIDTPDNYRKLVSALDAVEGETRGAGAAHDQSTNARKTR